MTSFSEAVTLKRLEAVGRNDVRFTPPITSDFSFETAFENWVFIEDKDISTINGFTDVDLYASIVKQNGYHKVAFAAHIFKRFSMEVKLILNGVPSCGGYLLVAFSPKASAVNSIASSIELTHVFMPLNQSTTKIIKLPWVCDYTVKNEWSNPEWEMQYAASMAAPSGASTAPTFGYFLRFCDVVYAIPRNVTLTGPVNAQKVVRSGISMAHPEPVSGFSMSIAGYVPDNRSDISFARGCDEASFEFIASRPQALFEKSWSTNDAAASIFYSDWVTPIQLGFVKSPNPVSPSILELVHSAARYWKAKPRFTLMVFASAFHSGALEVDISYGNFDVSNDPATLGDPANFTIRKVMNIGGGNNLLVLDIPWQYLLDQAATNYTFAHITIRILQRLVANGNVATSIPVLGYFTFEDYKLYMLEAEIPWCANGAKYVVTGTPPNKIDELEIAINKVTLTGPGKADDVPGKGGQPSSLTNAFEAGGAVSAVDSATDAPIVEEVVPVVNQEPPNLSNPNEYTSLYQVWKRPIPLTPKGEGYVICDWLDSASLPVYSVRLSKILTGYAKFYRGWRGSMRLQVFNKNKQFLWVVRAPPTANLAGLAWIMSARKVTFGMTTTPAPAFATITPSVLPSVAGHIIPADCEVTELVFPFNRNQEYASTDEELDSVFIVCVPTLFKSGDNPPVVFGRIGDDFSVGLYLPRRVAMITGPSQTGAAGVAYPIWHTALTFQ